MLNWIESTKILTFNVEPAENLGGDEEIADGVEEPDQAMRQASDSGHPSSRSSLELQTCRIECQ